MDRGDLEDRARARFARQVLRFRAGAYATLAVIGLLVFTAGQGPLIIPVIAFTAAIAIPYLFPSEALVERFQVAIAADIVMSLLAWFYLPTDPALPLVIVLWSVTVAGFFVPSEIERRLMAVVLTLEFAKWPLAASLMPGRYAAASRLRDYFDSEWLVTGAASAGRLAIVAGTYALIRSIAGFYDRSQAAVSESRSQYQALVESTPTALLVIRDGTFVFASPSACRLFGVDGPEHIVGRKTADFVLSGDESRLLELLAKTHEVGEVAAIEGETVVLPNGTHLIVDVTFAPTVFEGTPAINAIVVDTTERHESTRTLAESEERYRAFFEQLPVPLYRTTPDGTIVDANIETARLLGVDSLEELVGSNVSEYAFSQVSRDRFVEAISATGHVIGHETGLRHSSGSTIWVRDSARRIDTANGPIFEGAMVDITDRVRVERELRSRALQQEAVARLGQAALSQSDLALLYEAAADALHSQLKAEITAVLPLERPELLRLMAGTGWPVGTVGNLTLDRDGAEHAWYVMDSGEPVMVESLEDDGRFRPSPRLLERGAVTGAGTRLPGVDGGQGVISAFRTEPFPFTEDDLHFLQAVANIVGAAMSRAAASERLEELVRSKDQFIASVSHEVRTPLTVVAGLAHELRDRWHDFSTDDLNSLTSMLVQQSQDMTNLIEDLLVAARADIGKVEVRPQLVSLEDEIAAVLSPLDRAESISVTQRTAGVKALADPVRLRQILRNLATNALRYGGPEVSMSAARSNGHARIEVRDNGAGIPVEERDRIFDAYHQAHYRTGQTASVGLGLTVSRRLAEMMDGSLTYHHDGDSVFTLTLPSP